ncbi:MAG: DUF962 domain-containing protein [Deltaproteobacteria bacterium]|nr:MAG: DUF962 domain-containing protein [Deltaproteobacteria bacterium]
MKEYKTLKEFYPYYLSQHANKTCRRLHFFGNLMAIILFLTFLKTGRWGYLIGAPLIGYLFAWIGHFGFEKNRPATFKYPLKSFICDWIMFKDILTRKIHF